MKTFFWANILLCLAIAVYDFTHDLPLWGGLMLGFAVLNYFNLRTYILRSRQRQQAKNLMKDLHKVVQKQRIDDLYGRNESTTEDNSEESE